MTTASHPVRRHVLRWLGVSSVGAAGLAMVRPAAAFQVLPGSDYQGVLEEGGCGTTAAHRQLLEQAAARLGVTVSSEQRRQVLAALRCPVCGCSLVGVETPAPPSP